MFIIKSFLPLQRKTSPRHGDESKDPADMV